MTSQEECESAAAALGLSDTTADVMTYLSYSDPPYCVLHGWSLDSGSLRFNNKPMWRRNGQINNDLRCRSSYQCICSGMAAPPSPPLAPGGYMVIERGTCESHDLRPLTSLVECESAAAALELSDTTAYVRDYSHDPPHCNTYNGYYLVLNTATSSTRGCSSYLQLP